MVRRIRSAEWLFPGGDVQPWIDALRAVDRDLDAAPLADLLKSGSPMPADARWFVADLLERYKLKRPRGGQRTPAYDLSEAGRRLAWAKELVRQEVANGRGRDDAVELAARVYGVGEEALCAFLQGKHASARRQKKRRPPAAGPAR